MSGQVAQTPNPGRSEEDDKFGNEGLGVPAPKFKLVNKGETFTSRHEPETFVNNRIVTAKYTWYNFLPKFLWEEFSKIANTYFFIVCCLQAVPLIRYILVVACGSFW
jgi:hypothetical protein